MKRLLVAWLVLVAIAGCTVEREQAQVETADVVSKPKAIEIAWQRYVDHSGGTCIRCDGTGAEIQRAYEILRESFAPEGIDVVMSQKVLSADAAVADMSQSNRVWISGRALEEWLGATVGTSACGGCCGELVCAAGKAGPSGTADCRTLIHEGRTFETIPSDLIVRAGFMAASEMLGREVRLCGRGVGICTCGGDPPACQVHAMSPCGSCPGAGACVGHIVGSAEAASIGGTACQALEGQCDPLKCSGHHAAKAAKGKCPHATQCAGGVCPLGK